MKGFCMQWKTPVPRSQKPGARLWSALAFAAVLAGSTAGHAQDEAKVKAGLSVWRSSGCSECHGAFADGEKERDEAPTGANLRQTRLDDATIAETIRCGRPGASMPSFGADAYKERGCYGQPAGAVPDDLYPAGRTLSVAEIGEVVTYLRARVIGKRAVTPAECAYYYGDQADQFCDQQK
jgi:cbb3-type cytochrome c oxidase subunit III